MSFFGVPLYREKTNTWKITSSETMRATHSLAYKFCMGYPISITYVCIRRVLNIDSSIHLRNFNLIISLYMK